MAVSLAVGLGLLPTAAAGPTTARFGPSSARQVPISPPEEGVGATAGSGTDTALGGTNEVTIAVSPTDPATLAMSSLYQYRISTDGGGSWGPAMPAVMPSGYAALGDPSLTFDSQGRLFYIYLGRRTDTGGVDILISQLNPATGALVAGPFKVTNAAPTTLNDRPWIAADQSPTSPFADRLYVAWTEFTATRSVFVTHSSDQGMTWSPATQLSTAADFLPWPTHAAVAANGDVYVSYHAQPGFACNPDGISGKVFVARSTNGGVTFPQKTLAFAPGAADITFNIQDCAVGAIPNTDFWMQGSAQAWVLPDPVSSGVVFVVANDDPDNIHGTGDDGDVMIVRSDNHGVTWGPPSRVDDGPGTTLQVFPTASIDLFTGCMAVAWYDTRNQATNAAGNYLLDVFYSTSYDGGLTFGSGVQINDVPFDPDQNAPIRYPGPPPTRRIGEYIGVAIEAGDVHVVWTGNNVSSQQAVADSEAAICEAPPPPPVPTMSAWGAAVLSLGLLIVGSMRLMRLRVSTNA